MMKVDLCQHVSNYTPTRPLAQHEPKYISRLLPSWGGEGRFTTVQILTLIHENITMFETKFSTFQYAVTSFFKMSKVANLIRTNFGGDNMVPIHLCSITQPSFAHKMFATF